MNETSVVDDSVMGGGGVESVTEFCETQDCDTVLDLSIGITERDRYVNAWGATNTLTTIAGFYVYLRQVKYWQDQE